MKPVEIEFLVKDNTRQGLSGVSGGIDGVERQATEARRSVSELEAEIARLKRVMAQTPEMDQTQNIRQIEALKKQLAELQRTAQQTDLTPKNAQAAIRTYNGLGMSVQQIARELPSLTMGPQMFFLAISNNLPILSDEIARARKEYDALVASGRKGTPVWRQLISSIASWQTLMVVGITLMVAYGKEIGDFFSRLFRGKEAVDMARISIEQFQSVMAEGGRNAQKEALKLELLYQAATDSARAMKERLEAVHKLKEEYPSYFENLSSEEILLGKANDAYKKLIDNIYQYAQAQAAFKSIVGLEEQRQTIENTSGFADYLQRYDAYLRAQESLAEAQKKFDEAPAKERRGNASPLRLSLIHYEAWFDQAERDLKAAQQDIFDEVAAFADGDKIVETIEKQFDGNLSLFLEFIDKQKEKYRDLAQQAQLMDNPTETPKPEASTTSVDRLADQLLEARRQQQELLDEQTVALMDEGTQKERAAIELRYRQTRAQYEAEERQTLELIKRLREEGKELPSGIENAVRADTALSVANAAKLRDKELAELDKKEAESLRKLLEKYETYEQGRLRIAEKYDKEIARLGDNTENRRIAERAKQQALDDFTVQFAGQFPEFKAWADAIVSVSLDKLRMLLAEAQEELENLRSETPGDTDAIARQQAKVITLTNRISGLEARQAAKVTDTTKWTELHRVLKDVIDTFNEVGDAVGGTAGEIIAAAGGIAGSTLQMINAVQAYKNAAPDDTLGKASGILGAVSAGVNILGSLFKALKGGETSWERNLRLAREFNEELRILRERSRIDSSDFDNIFGDRLYARYRQNVDAAREALERFEATQERLRTSSRYGLFAMPAKEWESAAQAVAAMQVQTRHSTWFRSAKYASLGSLLPELFGEDGALDMEALTKFVNEGGSTFQHLSEANRQMLREMTEDWETYRQALDAVNEYLSGIFGELGNTLTDALVEAFEKGTSAADTFVESVGQALRQLAKEMIYSSTLGQVFEDAQRRVQEINASTASDEEKFAQWSEAMRQLVTDALGSQEEFNRLWAEFRRLAEEQGLSIDQTTGSAQSGRTGALQAVTQESFSRVEGLVTSIQIHEANMDDELQGITPLMGRSLDALNKIAKNTDSLPQILALLQGFKRDGLKVL